MSTQQARKENNIWGTNENILHAFTIFSLTHTAVDSELEFKLQSVFSYNCILTITYIIKMYVTH